MMRSSLQFLEMSNFDMIVIQIEATIFWISGHICGDAVQCPLDPTPLRRSAYYAL